MKKFTLTILAAVLFVLSILTAPTRAQAISSLTLRSLATSRILLRGQYPAQLQYVKVTPFASQTLSPSSATATSVTFGNQLRTLRLYVSVPTITSGQSIAVQVSEIGPDGQSYLYPAFPAQTAAGNYLFMIDEGAASGGGAIPVGGVLALLPPTNFQVVVTFGDTSGTKSITYSVTCLEES